MSLIIGFTGTREGMANEQQRVVQTLMVALRPTEAHHGDCIGADAEFHEIARAYGYNTKLIGHPPVNDKFRAFCKFDAENEPKDYHVRNRDIVDDCDILIGAPKGFNPKAGGGTWQTINYATNKDRFTLIVWPDGDVTL